MTWTVGNVAPDGRHRVVARGVVDDPDVPGERAGAGRQRGEARDGERPRVPAHDHHRHVDAAASSPAPPAPARCACARRSDARVCSAERRQVNSPTRPAPSLSQPRGDPWLAEHPLQRLGQRGVVLGVDEERRVAGHLGDGAAIRGDDRRAVGHRLEQRDAEAFDPRRERRTPPRRRRAPPASRSTAGPAAVASPAGHGRLQLRQHLGVTREEHEGERAAARSAGKRCAARRMHGGVLEAVGEHVAPGDAVRFARSARTSSPVNGHPRRRAVIDHVDVGGGARQAATIVPRE